MNDHRLDYFLFPHTSPPETDARRLTLVIPRVHLLEVLDRPVLSPWAEKRFPGRKVIGDAALLASTRSFLKELRDLARIHGYGGALASMNDKWRAQTLESRAGIQSELSGRSIRDADMKQALLMEAAVFIEMAQELDERQRDLDAIKAESNRMEADLKKILGVSPEEDLDEAAQLLSPPLAAENRDILYMLANRMACWSRLFLHASPDAAPVLVALSGEVVEEVLDPLRTHCERLGMTLPVQCFELPSIPAPDGLSDEAFEALLAELRESGLAESLGRSLDRFITLPEDDSARKEIDRVCDTLGGRVRQGLRKSGIEGGMSFRMTLVKIGYGGNVDFWECLDKETSAAGSVQVAAPPAGILHLSGV